jgi:rhodanese-related sulfurtransferase
MPGTSPAPVEVPGIDATAAMAVLRGDAVLLDVREQNEWDAGHAPVAVHIPLARVAAETATLPTDRPVVVVCRSGRRSAAAVSHLLTAGIQAVNLDGGMQAWQRGGGDLVAGPGVTPAVI